jgi:hypothetical protein
VVEWIWKIYGGKSQWEGMKRRRGCHGGEHGWWRRKKKEDRVEPSPPTMNI